MQGSGTKQGDIKREDFTRIQEKNWNRTSMNGKEKTMI